MCVCLWGADGCRILSCLYILFRVFASRLSIIVCGCVSCSQHDRAGAVFLALCCLVHDLFRPALLRCIAGTCECIRCLLGCCLSMLILRTRTLRVNLQVGEWRLRVLIGCCLGRLLVLDRVLDRVGPCSVIVFRWTWRGAATSEVDVFNFFLYLYRRALCPMPSQEWVGNGDRRIGVPFFLCVNTMYNRVFPPAL